MAKTTEVFITEYLAEWLNWFASHPYVDRIMSVRDRVVDWYDEMPIQDRIQDASIRTINWIEAAIISIFWMLLKLIWRIWCLLFKAWLLWLCGFLVYLMMMVYWNTYKPPVVPERFKGNVILSGDYCFVNGIVTPAIKEWCQSQRPEHASHIEIIITTGW